MVGFESNPSHVVERRTHESAHRSAVRHVRRPTRSILLFRTSRVGSSLFVRPSTRLFFPLVLVHLPTRWEKKLPWGWVGGTKGLDVVGATRWTRPAWNRRHGHWKRWNETPKTKTNRKDGAEETRPNLCTSTTKTKGKRRHARRNQRTRNEARRTRRTSMSEAWEKEEACQRKGEETKDVPEANVARGYQLAHPHTSHTRTDDVAPRARGANANVPTCVGGDACLENKDSTKEGTVPDERRHRNRRTLHWLTLSRWPCPRDLTCSPLHDAAQVGDLQMIRKLLNIPTNEVGNAMAVRSCVSGRRRIVD